MEVVKLGNDLYPAPLALAEVGDNDKWQTCRLGVAVVSNRSDHVHSQISAIVRMVEREQEMFVVDYSIEVG